MAGCYFDYREHQCSLKVAVFKAAQFRDHPSTQSKLTVFVQCDGLARWPAVLGQSLALVQQAARELLRSN